MSPGSRMTNNNNNCKDCLKARMSSSSSKQVTKKDVRSDEDNRDVIDLNGIDPHFCKFKYFFSFYITLGIKLHIYHLIFVIFT